MKKNKKNRPVSPIYVIAGVVVVFSLISPIWSLLRILLAGLLAGLGFFIARSIVGSGKKKEADAQQAYAAAAEAKARAEAEAEAARRRAEAEAAARAAAEQARPKYPPEVQAIVDEGARARTELKRLYASIPDLAVKRKIAELIDISDKIVADAVADPSDVPQIKKFLDYYLPTTIKLLNAYDRMGAQGIQGENITGTMKSIDQMLDTAIAAYKKLLDSLFANQAMDIETDISVMNTLLQREGLSGGGISAAGGAK